MEQDPTLLVLMYFVVPVWLMAGFADWLCHRATNIETTSCAKESVLHLLLFAEVAGPFLAALLLDINALVLAFMIVMFFVHEATTLWDLSYAVNLREITPIEQHVHSYLEMMPLMGLLLVAARHWPQFLALFGFGDEAARFDIALKVPPLPPAYIFSAVAAALLFAVLPYTEELWRGLRANNGRFVPGAARLSSR
ncbi:diguanylate cyclase [Methylocystis sp. L43]|uniref:diguanylate cyclase n=1 Tax=unclassified Methylocystis TaxID=2625913 RepID=UPI0018C2CDFB|nr:MULTISPECIES: diguanylate cyclase [unclassified Methylocystis]MBG0799846.1 diguanylate cyclase [Methylocystis sp. L43]MBG0807629.1 diguanylate cyclase [Methylocystis sp. H15]